MHKTYSHPIPVPLAAARRAPMSPLNAELVEFESWLETTLHLLGADGVLYARCVLSILRQTIDDGRVVGRRQSPDVLQNVTVVKSLGRDAVLSFPPGAMANVVNPLDPDAELPSPTGQTGPRRRALLECLRTVELDERKLRELTDEILARYVKVVTQCGTISGNASQNDSIDSGVCPSPVESDQNYDEAFPPLSDVENDDDDRTTGARRRKTSTTGGGKKPATAPVPIPSATWASSSLASNNNSSKINNGANWACSSSAGSGKSDNNSGSKCATSCATAISTTTLTPSTSVGNELLATSLRTSSIGNKLTAPFTREWAARSAELFGGGGMGRRSRHTSMSKGEAAVVAAAATSTNSSVVSSSVPHRFAQHHHVYPQQSHPHFVVARAPSTTAGGSKVFSGASKLEYNYSGLPGGRRSALMLSSGDVSSSLPTADDSPIAASSLGAMLSSHDAPPRFILHNIKEHQPPVSLGRQLSNSSQSMATLKPQYHQPQPPVYFDAPMPNSTALPGFGFDPWAEQQHQQQQQQVGSATSAQRHRLQLDDHMATLATLMDPPAITADEDFFCMPRMQDVIEACQLPLPEPQPTAATFVDSILQTDAGVKIPVSPNTHFVPIRSESMEEAYVPANFAAEDELDYAIDFFGAERYFVLRNHVDEFAPSQPPTKRSLPIKFKALLPEKHCQTNGSVEKGTECEWVGTDEWRTSVVEAVIASSSDDDIGAHKTIPKALAGGSSVYVPEGDNTVALPDAWANVVWEPRLSIASSTEEERWPNEPGFRAVMQGSSRRHHTINTAAAAADQQSDMNNDVVDTIPAAHNNALSVQVGCDIHQNKKRLATPPDDDDGDLLLRYVNNINLLSPLDSTYVAAV